MVYTNRIVEPPITLSIIPISPSFSGLFDVLTCFQTVSHFIGRHLKAFFQPIGSMSLVFDWQSVKVDHINPRIYFRY